MKKETINPQITTNGNINQFNKKDEMKLKNYDIIYYQ